MIFVDTGAFLARYIARDQHHSQAVADWKELGGERVHCFTTNSGVAEILTLLGRRAG